MSIRFSLNAKLDVYFEKSKNIIKNNFTKKFLLPNKKIFCNFVP